MGKTGDALAKAMAEARLKRVDDFMSISERQAILETICKKKSDKQFGEEQNLLFLCFGEKGDRFHLY